MNFYERKKERADRYHSTVEGWKIRNCTACAGSGHYDSDGSPPCGACDGTGDEKYKPDPKRPLIRRKKIYELDGGRSELVVWLDNDQKVSVGTMIKMLGGFSSGTW